MENGLLDLEFLLLVHTKLIAKLAFCQMNKIEHKIIDNISKSPYRVSLKETACCKWPSLL